MKVHLRSEILVIVPESDHEAQEHHSWNVTHPNEVFWLRPNKGTGAVFASIGPRESACNKPINIWSKSEDPEWRLISNFANTPFQMEGEHYETVESFWQGLKFGDAARRREIAAMNGSDARRAGSEVPYGATVTYQGESVTMGTWEHWQLMERACRAKFTQNRLARTALLATGTRPLTHKVRRDSRTIPGVIMADIWMRIRTLLQSELGSECVGERAETD